MVYQQTSAPESGKALVRRVIEQVWNEGDSEALEASVQPGFLRHHERNRDADLHGVDAFRDWVMAVRRALPDLRLSVEQILCENDKVMVHLQGAGTHRGTLGGMTATGTPLVFTSTAILRIADGRVAEAWVITDTLGILQQLGVVGRPG